LLKVNQTEQDTFLNIFGDEFVKIANALHAKRLKNQAIKEEEKKMAH